MVTLPRYHASMHKKGKNMNNAKLQSSIERECSAVRHVPGVGLCFLVEHLVCICPELPSDNCLQFSIPHVLSTSDIDNDCLQQLVNGINCERRFVKAFVLQSGSLALTYDHHINSGDNVPKLVHHMVGALSQAVRCISRALQQAQTEPA